MRVLVGNFIILSLFATPLAVLVKFHKTHPTSICPQTAFEKKDFYYECRSPTVSTYLHLRANGTYQHLMHDCGTLKEYDQGTWTQDKAGKITFFSNQLVRSIEYGPLSIYVANMNDVQKLHSLQSDISWFLNKHRKNKFSVKEIEGIRKYKSSQNEDYSEEAISVDSGVDDNHEFSVDRSILKGLLQELKVYLKDKNKNVFHAKPITYKAYTFLVWNDFGTSLNRNENLIKSLIDDSRIDNTKGSRPITPSLVYFAVDRESFESKTQTDN